MSPVKKTTTAAAAAKPKAAPKPKPKAETPPTPTPPPPPKKASLHEIGLKHGTDKATYHNFCQSYEKHLPSDIDSLLEIGVGSGASIKMWAEWLPKAKITGLDSISVDVIDKPSNVTILTGDLPSDQEFDVVVDDASHKWRDQIENFNKLWKSTKKAYIIEDIHTSLNKAFKLGPTPTYTNAKDPDESFPALDFNGIEHKKIVIKNAEADSWSVMFIK